MSKMSAHVLVILQKSCKTLFFLSLSRCCCFESEQVDWETFISHYLLCCWPIVTFVCWFKPKSMFLSTSILCAASATVLTNSFWCYKKRSQNIEAFNGSSNSAGSRTRTRSSINVYIVRFMIKMSMVSTNRNFTDNSELLFSPSSCACACGVYICFYEL